MADESSFKGARIMNVRQLSFVLVLGHVGGVTPTHPRTKTKTALNQSTTMEEITFPKLCRSPACLPPATRHPDNRSLSLQ